MAIALRGSAVVPVANPTTSFSVAIPSEVLADDLCYLTVTSRDSVGAGSLAVTDDDAGGNAWSKIANSTDHKATVWRKRATSGSASKTVTVTGAVGSVSGVLKCFSGADPGATPESNFVVEANASGNETHATFTADQDDSMLCCSIHNYNNDNAVTALTTANLGAFTQTEKLSSGGSDCACAFGHLLDSGAASATGSITWSQTNGTTYSITWAIKPQLAYTATAALSAGPVTLSGSAESDAPVYSGSAALSTGLTSFAGVGSFSEAIYEATASLVTAPATLSGISEFVNHPVGVLTQPRHGVWGQRYDSFAGKVQTPPTYTAAASMAVGAAVLSGTGAVEAEHTVGVLTQPHYGIWGGRYSSFADKGTAVYEGSASLSAGAAVLEGFGESDPPVFTGTAALQAGPTALTGLAVFVGPVYSGSAAVSSGPATFSGVAESTIPTYSGMADLLSPRAELTGSALSAAAVYQASGEFTVGATTLAGSATATAPHLATANLIAGAPTLSGSATFADPVYLGTINLMTGAASFVGFESSVPVDVFVPGDWPTIYVKRQIRTINVKRQLRTIVAHRMGGTE